MVSKKSRAVVIENKHRRLHTIVSVALRQDHVWLYLEAINLTSTLRLLTIQLEKTLVSASTLDKEVKAECEKTNNVDAAAVVGTVVAKRALEKGITTVVYDRGGFVYEGKVKALAEAAREAGLEF